MSIRATAESRDTRSSPPTLPDIKELGIDFLGPNALATLFSVAEMGIVIVYFIRFLARSKKEKPRIKFLVYFLTFTALCVSLWGILTYNFPLMAG
jgi:hypothetical protein